MHAGKQRDTGAKSAEGLRHGRTSIEITDWESCSSCDSFLSADRNALRCRYTTAGLLSRLQGKQPTVYSLMQAAGCKVSVIAPTSAGKTFISFYAMKQVLINDDDGVIVYVAPTKALINQIAAKIQARFSKSFKRPGKLV